MSENGFGPEQDYPDFDEFHGFGHMVPDGGVPIYAVECVLYLNADGETKANIRQVGEANHTEMVGLLELSKAHVLHNAEVE